MPKDEWANSSSRARDVIRRGKKTGWSGIITPKSKRKRKRRSAKKHRRKSSNQTRYIIPQGADIQICDASAVNRKYTDAKCAESLEFDRRIGNRGGQFVFKKNGVLIAVDHEQCERVSAPKKARNGRKKLESQATDRQVAYLRWAKIPHPANIGKREASRLIDRHKNGIAPAMCIKSETQEYVQMKKEASLLDAKVLAITQ